MEFYWRKPCPCGDCDVVNTGFRLWSLSVNYFVEWGDWFLYIHIGRRYFRFSSAGYLTGVKK